MKKTVFVGIVACALIIHPGVFCLAEESGTVTEASQSTEAEESGTVTEASQSTELDSDDCVKCHLAEARDIDGRGGLHKTDVGCVDCHEEHPPHGEDTIAQCDVCHAPGDHAHYTLADCKTCHYPHYPMEIDFSGIDDTKTACLSCHTDQGQEMDAHPSAHAELDCKECHLVHAEALECGQCHEAHTEEMSYEDCLRCHKPHMPTAIEFNAVSSAMCSGCHAGPTDDIEQRGAGHKEVECSDCHEQHPPSEEGVIPSCAMCHAPEDGEHYGVEGCESCHHPHYPMEIDFSGVDDTKQACLTCHTDQGQEMETHPSEHGALDCKECHLVHAEALECAECHADAHGQGMSYEECLGCHKPHMPMVVTYGKAVSSSFCVSCHADVGQDIAQSETKHQLLECIYCHENEHKGVVECQGCHGEPHESDISAKHPDCLECHENPHTLPARMDVDKMAEDCSTCHPEQLTECSEHVSAHTDVSCAECHHTSHGHIPGCTDCHEKPHAAGVDDAGCMACHAPHSPLDVACSEDVPNQICVGCHRDVGDRLWNSSKAHALIECVFCHIEKHGHVPECTDCHKTPPHSKEMLKEFKDCLACHGDAHNLNLSQ
jgi:predicted CXXCH cytochrome family protein